MARAGLYKSEVKKARDALLAQGKHPSVDAVRVELGNTGSKTTIHKYLRELEEEGGTGSKISISESLQDLVARLAAQLQEEANIQVEAILVQASERQHQHEAALAAALQELESVREKLQDTAQLLEQESREHGLTREALHHEAIVRHTAEEQVAGLKERLAENEAHRTSLEEKHQHAREALEHYRHSVKEQRDQDQRRHEQQVQHLQAENRQLQQTLIVKQDDVTRLNQEGVRLVSDLSHAQKALHEEKARGRQLEQRVEHLAASEQRCHAFEQKIMEKDAHAHEINAQLRRALDQLPILNSQIRKLELELAASQATLLSQEALTMQLRAFGAAGDTSGKPQIGKATSGT